jgi:hypothetical protein
LKIIFYFLKHLTFKISNYVLAGTTIKLRKFKGA